MANKNVGHSQRKMHWQTRRKANIPNHVVFLAQHDIMCRKFYSNKFDGEHVFCPFIQYIIALHSFIPMFLFFSITFSIYASRVDILRVDKNKEEEKNESTEHHKIKTKNGTKNVENNQRA